MRREMALPSDGFISSKRDAVFDIFLYASFWTFLHLFYLDRTFCGEEWMGKLR